MSDFSLEETIEMMAREAIDLYGPHGAVERLIAERDILRAHCIRRRSIGVGDVEWFEVFVGFDKATAVYQTREEALAAIVRFSPLATTDPSLAGRAAGGPK